MGRSDAEVEKWKKKDPVSQFEKELFKRKVLTKKAVGEIEKRIKREIEEAVAFAQESPFPEPHELYEGVYAD